MSTAERLRALAGRVSAERDSGAEDPGLDAVCRCLALAAERLDADDRAGAQQQLDQAARLVADSWSQRSELGAEVLQVARALRRG